MSQQHSESACQEGYSWGSDDRGIWVDHGCRADFVVEGDRGRGDWEHDSDRDRDRDRDRDQERHQDQDRDRENRGDNQSDQGQVVSCSSDDMHRHYCPADMRGGVQLIKQHTTHPANKGAVGVLTDVAFGWTTAAVLTFRSVGKFPG
jgi:hypothetical protein